MIGALALAAGAGLLAFTALRLASRLTFRSTAGFLLAAYVVAWVELVLVLWALSLPGWVSRWPLLLALALVCAAVAADTKRRSAVARQLADAAGALRRALADPLCAVLGVVVAAGFAYALTLGLVTPQNDVDTIVDHLWRARLWHQNGAAGYPECACAPYVNASPPHGELGVLATMTLGGADRYAALVQAFAYVALVAGVVGVARGLGLDRRQSLFGALLVATLPVIALQASTAQNDLLVASFLVAAFAFLLERGRAAPWLAGAATALAVGTTVAAVIGIPLLVLVAVLSPTRSRQGIRLFGVIVGTAAGAYWYAINWWQAGSWDEGFPYEPLDHGVAATVARALRSAIQLVELPGSGGRDRWLYAVVAALVLVGTAGVAAARRSRGAVVGGVVAGLIALAPVVTPDVRRYADEAYRDLWRAIGRDDLALEVGRDITRSASNVTWYGPLGAILVVAGLVAVALAVRRGALPDVAIFLALAPAYWLVALSVALFYQDAAGRFLMAPIALAGATWGLFGRLRPVAWGLAGIAATSMALAVLNDTKRPSGLPLLERPAPESYWTAPRWQAQGAELHVPALIRYVDEQVPAGARVALAMTANDAGYVFFGPGLDRRLDLLGRGATDAPRATWAFASPSGRIAVAPRFCGGWRRVADAEGWQAYRRVRGC